MMGHNRRMNLSHAATVVYTDRQVQVRRCTDCRDQPYQLWRRENQSDPLIDSFHADADAALAALTRWREREAIRHGTRKR